MWSRNMPIKSLGCSMMPIWQQKKANSMKLASPTYTKELRFVTNEFSESV